MIFTLLCWSGTKPAISLRYLCGDNTQTHTKDTGGKGSYKLKDVIKSFTAESVNKKNKEWWLLLGKKLGNREDRDRIEARSLNVYLIISF